MNMQRSFIRLCVLVMMVCFFGCSSSDKEEQEPTSGLDKDSLILACVRIAACDVQRRARLSDCVNAYTTGTMTRDRAEAVDPVLRCSVEATSCEAVGDCFGAGEKCDKNYKATCTDGVASFCDLLDDRVYAYDCGAVGLSCEVDPLATFGATCKGGGSGGTLRTRPDCEADHCTAGESCGSDSLDSCDGAGLKACVDGKWLTFDCDAIGMGGCVKDSAAHCGQPQPQS